MAERFPILSIITVCYNAEKTIAATFDSILSQKHFSDYELVVVDGNSSDSTNSIIEDYISKFEENNIATVYVSEKDNGVYDAMNKAALLSHGEWLIFMNADDMFADDMVLHDVFSDRELLQSDVIYGNTLCNGGNGYKLLKAKKASRLKAFKPFVHQSCFVKRDLQCSHLFDLKYKISADYDFFLKLYLKRYKFKKTNRVISVFSTGGMSCNKDNEQLVKKENKQIIKEKGINCFNTPSLIWYHYIKVFLRKIKNLVR